MTRHLGSCTKLYYTHYFLQLTSSRYKLFTPI